MGLNNQKVMSDEEKEIITKANKEKREKEKKDKETLSLLKTEIFEKSRSNLPQIIQQRTLEIANKLEKELYEIEGFDAPYIYSLIANPNILSVKVKLTTDELTVAFQEFMKVMTEINRYARQTPSIELFCGFIGISTNTYRNYLNDIDEERQNVMIMIDNYITGTTLQSSKNRQIDSSTAIFVAKSQHGLIEQNAPTIIRHELVTTDTTSMREKLKLIQQSGTINAEFEVKEE